LSVKIPVSVLGVQCQRHKKHTWGPSLSS